MKNILLLLTLAALTGCSRTPWVSPTIPHTAPSGGTKPSPLIPYSPEVKEMDAMMAAQQRVRERLSEMTEGL